jgi:hypothetical protein
MTRSVRECDGDRDGAGGFDQRRAAPDRHGARVDVELTIDDFQKVSDRVPFLADLKPSGKYVMEDLHKIGGTPAVQKYLLGRVPERRLPDGHRPTLAENVADLPGLAEGRRSSAGETTPSSRRATC